MSLKEKLQQDWKDALKGKDKFKANVISMAKAAILQIEKTKVVKLNDEEIIEVLAKEVKSRRDALLEFKKGKRQDLVDTANAEIEILMSYLPQQLTEDEIKDIIKSAASEVGANSIKDMGKVMAAIVPKTKGRADNSKVSSLVKEYLNK
ncbi:GatB/yqey domain-containing protein [Clostridium pasteurianum DSM 525 = ATCC 6013]|uniref:GatB/yqey domain-containing protein n=1 Tax=Clostridium pasteurianum DSM 525 = ATCC 6013 TaxID=1262449 RepID=A0A0H3J4H0_CLOPA|nr:GatB/YqeY domain-containing protein [Clostridium pasteurianum]AJA48374.1 GatB/yqey domain-containing protein [Clostridium pasteurianum DSM 525 = ATCC 6013]AJA52362.1 GatB/yqey domain-containing protein [Clostridium pasteurianum DSM 525 = ATCC 6013]AOZ75620.1 aspartyl-tRNA amidotransferase [Clostridium pasteurianum DSM 525 = ATCC 6013]AOZ79416.1 aspartyl-tRNA amidotransferase [Clostridium pasteurianum]ELP60476.1 hypothetical protein F502_03287 [Clostridium pasteurianum DSM 525 = ATCC 6013]